MPVRPLITHLVLLVVFGLGLAFGRGQVPEPVVQGAGHHRYAWVSDWPRLPEGEVLGYTHGCVVVDSQDRVFVNTDSEHAVVVFDADGELVMRWGADLAGGLHGMAIVQEGEREYLYLTHIVHGAVYKTTLEGELIWKLDYPAESGLYADASEYHPTSVAVAPNGHIYVADGYGKSWIHRYDADRKYLGSFGGSGDGPERLKNPHGLWVHTSGELTFLIVADRENGRIATFDLEGELLRSLSAGLRKPCHAIPGGGDLAVADIDGKVTILDGKGEVIAHLGENPDPLQRKRRNVPRAAWREGTFISPHCVRWDSKGDLYVVDWLLEGRLTKLRRLE